MSWISEVFADNEWVGNCRRYATEQEALDAGLELLSRWYVPKDYRAVESSDPVNAKFENWKSIHINVSPDISPDISVDISPESFPRELSGN